MGRPLRAKYANTTYVNGVQEMSNTDISSVIVPLISQHLVDNYSNPASVGLGQTLTIQFGQPAWGSNVVSGGNISDTKAATLWGAPVAIGDHPVTNTSSFGVSLWQNLNTADPFTAPADLGANRPLQTVSSGGVRRIQSMTDTEIENDIVSNVVSTMITGGLGAYWLGTTAPVDGGTWVVRSSVLYDTYNGPSGEITTNYYLWQKTATGSSVGTIRPLKRTANNQLQEMSNTDIVNLASHIRKYTVNTGIGLYSIGTSAPGTGTWISRGSFVDTRNVLSDDPYSGSYLSNPGFTGFFTGGYSGAYTSSYQAEYVGYYTRFFTGTYEGSYSKVGVFSGSLTYTGVSFTGVFSGATSSTWTKSFSNEFTAVYNGSYSRLFTGSYEGAYTRFFTGAYAGSYTTLFSGVYAGSYTALFTGVYTGVYTSAWASNFAGAYQNPFNAVYYAGSYAGTRNRNYTGVYGAYTGITLVTYGAFTGLHPWPWASPSSTFSATYTGSGGSFAGANYVPNLAWTRQFTGVYGSYTSLAVVGGQVQPIAYVAPNSQGTGFTATYGSLNVTWGVAYTRSFTGIYGSYTGAGNIAYSTLLAQFFFTGTFVNPSYSRTFSGFYQGGYASPNYTGTFNNFFGRVFTGVYGSYTGAGNIAYSSPTTSGTPAYAQTFSGNYTGIYSSTYVGPDPGGTYTGIYNNQIPFTRLFTGSYSGLTVSSSTVTTTYTLWVRTA